MKNDFDMESVNLQTNKREYSVVIQPAAVLVINMLIGCAIIALGVSEASLALSSLGLSALFAIGLFGHKLDVTEQRFTYKLSFLMFHQTRQFEWSDVQRVIYEKNNKRNLGKVSQDDRLVFYFYSDKKTQINLWRMQTSEMVKLMGAINTFTQAHDIPFEEDVEKQNLATLMWSLILMMVFGFCFLMFYVLNEPKIHVMSSVAIILSICAMWLLPYFVYWFWQKWRLAPEQVFTVESQGTGLLVSGLLVIGLILFANRLVTEHFAPQTNQTFNLIALCESTQTWQSTEKPVLTFDIETSNPLAIVKPKVGDKHEFVLANGWLGDYVLVTTNTSSQKR